LSLDDTTHAFRIERKTLPMTKPPPADQLLNRVVLASGIHNFRDYGGYAAQGGRLATATLYRSGELSRATAADRALVASLGVATVIDLRSAHERQHSPSRLEPDFTGNFVFSPEYTVARPPHVQAAQRAPDAGEIRSRLTEAYAKMPFQRMMISVFAMYFHSLASVHGPTLVHCAAGKDRTGIAVALLQAALGVNRDDVMADFMLTNTAGNVAARHAALAPTLRQGLGPMATEEALLITLSVEPQYLEAMFAAIQTTGGLDAYLKATLGLDTAKIEALRHRLIV
jgi:protein-tyrosine phosphatase